MKEWHTRDLLDYFCTQERVLLATLYCFVYICYGHEMTYEQSRNVIAAGYGCEIEGRPNSIIIMQMNSRTLPRVRPEIP